MLRGAARGRAQRCTERMALVLLLPLVLLLQMGGTYPVEHFHRHSALVGGMELTGSNEEHEAKEGAHLSGART